ncbi:MAG: CoA transferase [Pseudomonadota bacterium]
MMKTIENPKSQPRIVGHGFVTSLIGTPPPFIGFTVRSVEPPVGVSGFSMIGGNMGSGETARIVMDDNVSAPQLLDGVTVLDFTHWLAGPTCTRILSDLGAEVIKVEPPPDGEHGRGVMQYDGVGAMFAFASAGKKSLCIDIKSARGKALIQSLARSVDVIVENFAPGVLARLGFGYDELKSHNPKLILASCSGFGQFGPLSDKTSFDIIGQAMSGVMDMTGDPDGPPQYVGNYIGDPNTGIHAALAICAALFRRSITNEGCRIDISQMEALLWLDMVNVAQYSLSQRTESPSRFGAHHFVAAPLGVFKGKQGYIVIQAMEHQWPNLADAMDRPDLKTDARFGTNDARMENLDALVALIERWLADFPDDESALSKLRDARIPSAPVLNVAEAFEHPHTRARGMVKTVEHPILGKFEVTNTPFFINGRTTEVQGPPPLVGQHNREILSHHLGLDREDIEALLNDGIIAQERAVNEPGRSSK